jgi:hypothetical protein
MPADRTLLRCFAAFALLLPAALPLAAPTAPADGALHESMEELKSAMRKVGRAVEQRDAEAALPHIERMQVHVVGGKGIAPHVEHVPAAERAAFMTGYRLMMIDLLRATCDLEAALLRGDHDEAARLFRDVLKPMEDAGHEKYRHEE